MSFVHNFDEIYEDSVLLDGGSSVGLDFASGFAPQPVLQAQSTEFFEGLELIQLPDSFVQSMLDRGIPVGEGEASNFSGQPSVFSSGAIPGLTAPASSNFAFDFVVNTGGNTDLDAFIPIVVEVASAAMEYLGQFIVGADGASLEVGINLLQQGPSVLASAGAAAFFLGGENADGVTEIFTGTQIELITGNDPNGDDVDIFININTDFLTQPSAFFDTDPDRVVPGGSLDYVSILVHEILHGLGFFSFRDASGQDVLFDLNGDGQGQAIESTYGLNVSFEDLGDPFLSATYDSTNIRNVYGDRVQLETTFESAGSDVSHFALFNPDGTIADTAIALMNPAANRGDVGELGLLELSVLQDLFYNVVIPEDTPLVNQLDGLPFTPTIATPSSIGFAAGQAGFDITLDNASLFSSLPGGVGVEVLSLAGESFAERVFVPADATNVGFALSEEALRSIVETDIAALQVRLFGPAQLQLESTEAVTLTFIADLDLGTDGDDMMAVNLNLPSIYFAGAGNDSLFGNGSEDIFYGEDGDDALFGRAGDDGLYGGDGNDYLGGASGNDLLDGGAGNDDIFAGSGNDTAFGGDGDDMIDGGGNNDFIDGGTGNDILLGGNGADQVFGGDGADDINGQDGNDSVFGGNGNDVLRGEDGDDLLEGGAGDDILIGGRGADTIRGGSGDDIIAAGSSADFVNAGSGNDEVIGGGGDDTILGGRGDDIVEGQAGNDRLFGQTGDDLLAGGDGDDELNGGAGTDNIFGGDGADVFVTSRGNEVDVVIDFEDGVDMLDLSDFSDAEIQNALDNRQVFDTNVNLVFDDGTVVVLIGIDSEEFDADDILNFEGVEDTMPMV